MAVSIEANYNHKGVIEHNHLGHEWPYVLAGDYRLLAKERDQLKQALSDAKKDTERLDWLETQVVNVRTPLIHGSLEGFWSRPEDLNGEDGPSNIRQAIDFAIEQQKKGSGE